MQFCYKRGLVTYWIMMCCAFTNHWCLCFRWTEKMLLRQLCSRLGLHRSVENIHFCLYASASFSQSCHLRSYESKLWNNSDSPGPGTPRTYYLNLYRQNTCFKHDLPAVGGYKGLFMDSRTLTDSRIGQYRFYSTDLVKSILKPTLKPVMVPGKRVPKGPRTKQPSRANQPLKEDKVFQTNIAGLLVKR